MKIEIRIEQIKTSEKLLPVINLTDHRKPIQLSDTDSKECMGYHSRSTYHNSSTRMKTRPSEPKPTHEPILFGLTKAVTLYREIRFHY